MSTSIIQIAAIAGGGALGAVLRHFVQQAAPMTQERGFPFGILFVNLVGCFLIGCLDAASKQQLSPLWKLALGVGFFGALTTFSTLCLDAVTLLRSDRPGIAVLYLVVSLVIGICLVLLGQNIGGKFGGPLLR